MARILIILSLCLFSTLLYAQSESTKYLHRKKNNFSLAMGTGSIVSLQYERLFPINQKFFLAAGGGIGYSQEIKFCFLGDCVPNLKFTTIPYYLTGVLGKGENLLEFGLGATEFISKDSALKMIYPILAYRLQPRRKSRLMMRLIFSYPIYGKQKDLMLLVPFGVTIGYQF